MSRERTTREAIALFERLEANYGRQIALHDQIIEAHQEKRRRIRKALVAARKLRIALRDGKPAGALAHEYREAMRKNSLFRIKN